jgi:hypothetical protein
MARRIKGKRITGTARAKLAADLKVMYEKGASIRALAESTGRSYGFVHRLLSEAGVQIRETSGAAARQRGVSGLRPSVGHTDMPPASNSSRPPQLHEVVDWPVSIYLRDGSRKEGGHVQQAVRLALAELGFELTAESDPIYGSFWQRARAWSKEPQTKKALAERVAKLERAAEVHLLALPESQANLQNAQGAAAIIEALKDETAAVVQLGPLLIVKVPDPGGRSITLCKTLTASELKKLEQNPGLLADPIELVAQLPSFAEPAIEQSAIGKNFYG